MNEGEKLEKFMEFVYDEYQDSENSTFQELGETSSVLVNEFVDSTDIELGDDVVRLCIEKGFLKGEASKTRTRPVSISFVRVRLTSMGIEHVENRRRRGRAVLKAAPTLAEMIGRGLKGFFGG